MLRWTAVTAALAVFVTGCQVDPRTTGVPRAVGMAKSTAIPGCRAGPVRSALAGRVIRVSRISDIALGPKEVVLTFDDGPLPGRTERILATLDRYGVQATFFVVGRMARAYPSSVRRIAQAGHSVGHHTDTHRNLARMGRKAALVEIARGERAVAKALIGSGRTAAPFFRFPYLAHTTALRRALAARGTVVIDADIDSKDYFKQSPSKVLARTLARLRRKGRGVVLFHDIHERTVRLLPGFLAALKKGGFKVVHLVPANAGRCPPVRAS
ncbi:MAG: polysaccharide deacetylase family protein [Pseudomonadota bacterium]